MIWTERRLKLAYGVAALFAGTPHRDRLCLPGEGVDCIHFVAAVLVGAGVIDQPELPGYDSRHGATMEHNIIEDILLAHLHCHLVEFAEASEGDIIVCKCGRQSNHIGIVLHGEFWHSRGGSRCGSEGLIDWQDRIQSIVRITATGLKADPSKITEEQMRSNV